MSQQPETQTSNQNEHAIANEDLIILFHKENMDILVRMRINSSLITSITKAMIKVITKAMTRVLADQQHFRHLSCNITNLGVQST